MESFGITVFAAAASEQAGCISRVAYICTLLVFVAGQFTSGQVEL
jgi:hypothetical protein